MRQFLLTAGLGLALMPAIAMPAWAVDAQSVSDRLVKLLGDEGVEIEVGSAKEDGDDVVLADVQVGDGDKQFSYDEIRLEDVTEDGDYFRIQRAELPARAVDLDEETKLDLSAISFEQLQLLRQDDPDNIAPIQVEAFQMDRLAVSVPAGEFVRMENLSATGMSYDPEKPMSSTGSIGRFVFNTQLPYGDESNAESSRAMRQQLADLGYSTIEGRGEGSGRYDPQNGTLTFVQRMEFDDAATLQFEGKASAVTPELMLEFQKLDRKISQVDDEERQFEMMTQEMAPLYRQVVLNKFSLRIDDASLTDKIIGVAAKRQNAQPEQLKLQMAMIAPAVLASYVPADLAQKVGAALQTYLNDPQSLSIMIEPKDGTTVGQIADTAKSNPQELPALLNPDIMANQAE
ncbi:hypothetical protein [Notoacmeibacter sp. MSK16QG-6]|uniref:hypothetical protein n=1 Tax=Notoacmeibacter sp. MSK16QG-6 TaxID=2957982 RepID=UPI00209FBE46|nr:hypothetical protein [Notoacmeibacter sp. MSK16QG-6]MCP1198474.1 hypothetical protein [Notoacmeibacter sp. MSK16QG-6]